MALAKLTFQAYSDPTFSEDKKVGNPYSVQINPDEYSHNYTIKYNDTSAPGAPGISPGFNRMGQEKVTFTIWFDGTGIVPETPRSQRGSSIHEQIDAFKSMAFRVQGETHSPNYLIINWGTLNFRGRLVSMEITYTMFRPSGEPIRAKCTVSFSSYTSQQELAKEAKKASPDVSHLVSVKAGDTLPLLCYRVYGTSVHYAAVARANGLAGFRNLPPGTELVFPPLRTAKA
ncbi:MAG: tail protein X [Acidobacteriota bacterium]